MSVLADLRDSEERGARIGRCGMCGAARPADRLHKHEAPDWKPTYDDFECALEGYEMNGEPMPQTNPHVAQMEELGSRLAVDADGYVWWVHNDGTHSMVRTNPDNNPTPMPFTFFVRDSEERLTELEKAAREVLDPPFVLGAVDATTVPLEALDRLRALLADTEGGSDE